MIRGMGNNPAWNTNARERGMDPSVRVRQGHLSLPRAQRGVFLKLAGSLTSSLPVYPAGPLFPPPAWHQRPSGVIRSTSAPPGASYTGSVLSVRSRLIEPA